MKTRTRPDTRTEELEAREFEEMLASRAFRHYRARLVTMYQTAALQCIREESDMVLRRAQGAAESLRAVSAVPETMLAELKKKPNNRT